VLADSGLASTGRKRFAMTTRKLSSIRIWLFALMLALAPVALTGCQSTGGGSSDGHAGHSH
jgi:hypothetical protein